MKKSTYLGLFMLLLASCSKDNDEQSAANAISNRLNFIIDDNQVNFSYFNAGLSRSAYRVKLSETGPYTVLLPDNNAFIKAGYTSENDVLTESGTVLENMISYHITNGVWELNKLPFKFNQEIQSVSGGTMYITRWLKNKDTVTTINGTRVLSYNLKASNGVIQVLDAVLAPLVHATLPDAIAANDNLTYLSVAIKRAGMTAMFSGKDAFTIFAPNNAAFVAAGYPNIEAINATDPAKLKELLAYNCFAGRKFIYDYVLTTDASDQNQQAMSNGANVSVTLLKTGVNYTGISIRGIGNTAAINIRQSNVLAGNGVLHVTDGILKQQQ